MTKKRNLGALVEKCKGSPRATFKFTAFQKGLILDVVKRKDAGEPFSLAGLINVLRNDLDVTLRESQLRRLILELTERTSW